MGQDQAAVSDASTSSGGRLPVQVFTKICMARTGQLEFLRGETIMSSPLCNFHHASMRRNAGPVGFPGWRQVMPIAAGSKV